MSSSTVLSAAICLVLVVMVTVLVSQPTTVNAETVALSGPPERPTAFKNEAEAKEYLRALSDYFTIVGRPRFGRKRSLSSYASQYRLAPIEDEFEEK